MMNGVDMKICADELKNSLQAPNSMYHHTRYIVSRTDGNGGLITSPRQEESIEGCMEAIDESNARAVANGWKPSRYLICFRTGSNIYDENGQFVSSIITTTAIGVYPQTLSKSE